MCGDRGVEFEVGLKSDFVIIVKKKEIFHPGVYILDIWAPADQAGVYM